MFLWTYLSVRHSLASCLLAELSACGVKGCLHSCIYDFLRSHIQCVAINGTLSSALPVEAGVLQHSVLGPVLFLRYINGHSFFLQMTQHCIIQYTIPLLSPWARTTNLTHQYHLTWKILIMFLGKVYVWRCCPHVTAVADW